MPTVSHWQAAPFDPLPRSETAGPFDVAIAGGGMAGVSTAYWLRKLEPSLRVVLLERDRLASGASGRNAGFLLQGADPDYALTVDRLGRDAARRLWRLTEQTREGLREALVGADVGLEGSGSYVLAGDAAEDERLRRSEVLLREDGVTAHYLPPKDAAQKLRCRGLSGALAVPGGGVLDPARVARALAAQSGAEIREGWAVDRVQGGGGGVRLHTNRGTVEARRVVLALNAYLPQLVPSLGRFVRPVRAQMLATAPQARTLDAPVYSHQGYFYLRQMPTGEVLLGGARHFHVEAEVGYEDATTELLQDDLGAYLRQHFLGLSQAPVTRRWSGTMGFSPDGLPAIGRVPNVEGAWWVGGFTGHGMAYGFRTARTVAAAVLDRPDEFADLLSAERLAEGCRQ